MCQTLCKRWTDLVLLDLALGVVLKVSVSLEPALDQLPELFRETGVVQVMNSQTGSGSLARVRGSNTSLGRPDGLSTEFDFLETVDDLVEAEDQVRSVADEQSAVAVKTLGLDRVELLEHGRRVDDETGTDERDTLGVDQARGQGVEGVLHPLAGFRIVDDDGVSGVISSGTSGTDVGFRCENVGKLAFSFVTPLGSEAVRGIYQRVERCYDQSTRRTLR
jgi:hypothetical protein